MLLGTDPRLSGDLLGHPKKNTNHAVALSNTPRFLRNIEWTLYDNFSGRYVW